MDAKNEIQLKLKSMVIFPRSRSYWPITQVGKGRGGLHERGEEMLKNPKTSLKIPNNPKKSQIIVEETASEGLGCGWELKLEMGEQRHRILAES